MVILETKDELYLGQIKMKGFTINNNNNKMRGSYSHSNKKMELYLQYKGWC